MQLHIIRQHTEQYMSANMLVGPKPNRTNAQVHAIFVMERRLDVSEGLVVSGIIDRIQRGPADTEGRNTVVSRFCGDRRLVTIRQHRSDTCVECTAEWFREWYETCLYGKDCSMVRYAPERKKQFSLEQEREVDDQIVGPVGQVGKGMFLNAPVCFRQKNARAESAVGK